MNARAYLRPRLPVLFALVLFATAPCFSLRAQAPGAPRKAATSGKYTISGTVVSAATGTPLAQARVTLTGTSNSQNTASLLTGEGGRFAFGQLEAGKYSLRGSRRGYLASGYQQHEQFWSAIVTGEAFETQNLVLRLMPAGVISGKVLDEMGEPVRNAQAKLYMEGHSSGMTRVTLMGNTQTNDLGVFEFFSLSPGKYFAAVSATPWYAVHPPSEPQGVSETPPMAVDKSLDVTYPMTYYGGTTESDEASPIMIKGGAHEEIEIHLTPVESLRLRFHIPEQGQREGFQVPILEKHVFDSVEYISTEGVNQISPGFFEMNGVPAGKYTVRIPGAQGQGARFTEADIRNDGQELETDEAEPAANVKLAVRLANGEPLPKQLGLGLQDERRQVAAFSAVGPEGTVAFDDLAAGSYKIIATRTPEKAYAVGRILTESGQPVGPTLNVPAGAELQFNVKLVSGVASVEGFAKRGDKPASGVMVVLIPAEPETHQDLFRRDQSDSDGSFSLPDIIPGTYTVVAIEDAWDFDWSQPSALTRYAKNGQPVTISENKQGTIHLAGPIQMQPR
jgi:5-hydroxyisourate hydrolase-like protein (transthyretin family)